MQFDEDYLEKVGLGALPEQRKADFLKYIQDSLELRVGQKMSEGLTDAQLREFDELAQGGDNAAVQAWIRENCPRYWEIAREELQVMTEELVVRSEEILLSAK